MHISKRMGATNFDRMLDRAIDVEDETMCSLAKEWGAKEYQ